MNLGLLFGTATIVPDAIDELAAAALRQRTFTRYGLLDRGSYEVSEGIAVPPAIVAHAAAATGRTLAVVASRLLCLRAGDYVLAHHDPLRDDNPVEIVLDLSPATVPGAEVCYRRRGQPFFRVPSAPGSLAIVERGPTVTSNHAYVSKLHPTAVVMRLVALLR